MFKYLREYAGLPMTLLVYGVICFGILLFLPILFIVALVVVFFIPFILPFL